MSLSALAELLLSNTKELEAAYAKVGETVPTLETLSQTSASDADPAVDQIRDIIVAAAHQVIQTVRPVHETLQLEVMGVLSTNALGIAEEYNFADALAEAGPKGLHIDELSARVGLDIQSIERVMRFLASRHIFKEVLPNTFVNNRISTLMQKNKPLAEIKANPDTRYSEDTLAAAVSYTADDLLLVTPYLSKFLRNPGEWETPFNMAHQSHAKFWEYFDQPGNEWRLRRFAAFMKSAGSHYTSESVGEAINGKSLAPGSVVVDLGGSTGHATMSMYKSFPNLKYIIQDLPELEKGTKEYWGAEAPEALQSSTVTFMPHSFLDPQPVKGAAVYFFRVVLHNWPDKKVVQIMKHLRDVAAPTSKLVVLDPLQEYTCVEPGKKSKVPAPLLENLGIAGTSVFGPVDFQMWMLFNSRERTEENFRGIASESGWKLDSVKPGMLATYTFSVV
ncbi:S-adenosyl-L-methionine-dependent methyltransferase [Cylindrobasidium torrendii FP15055 ss-10]|uniref:S-adenosyl-L-methionine-dependent methyltransferase n=1 Tax=Cylindrobasidium torrendii FP15055 ss-10 TaxID=1314674 RepID=A0A0D7BBY1_9AGAR|nr:S-adenosyl-L-methionine-dependent methyltransferase [Cylindrobasidium torrendii FP15055 ss-10]